MRRRRLTREQSQQQTRERLLDAAAEVFARRGFYAASVEEVAETAGYSKGAVYSNFASKVDLFIGLLDRHLEQALQDVERAAELRPRPQGAASGPQADMADQPESAPYPDFAGRLEPGHTWNVLAMEFWLYAMRDERTRTQLAERYRRGREALAEQLRKQVRADGESSVPAEYLAWALIALGIGLIFQAYLEPGSGPRALPADLYRTIVGQLLGRSAPAS